jgi:hypothetical protein
MKKIMASRGDTHNFGKHVESSGNGWILKPRTVFWERLFLDVSSPFRRGADRLGGPQSPFAFLPRLRFARHPSLRVGGLVEALQVSPLREKEVDPSFILENMGGLLAVCSWFGMDDMHCENLKLGCIKETSRWVMGPVDIEMIFKDIRSPCRVGILPVDEKRRFAAGIKCVNGLIRSQGNRGFLAILYGYLNCLHHLVENAGRYVALMEGVKGVVNAPVRVLLRNSEDYAVLMGKVAKKHAVNPELPLLVDEIIQMERGDLPYFFCTQRNKAIRYYANSSLRREHGLLLPGLAEGRAIRTLEIRELMDDRERNRQLFEEGGLQLVSSMNWSRSRGRFHYRDLTVELSHPSHRIVLGQTAEISGAPQKVVKIFK